MTNTEALRLLERLTEWEPLGDCHRGVKCSACGAESYDVPFPHALDCSWVEARAFLAGKSIPAAETAVLVEIVERYISLAWLKDLDKRAEEERKRKGWSLISSTGPGADAISLRALLTDVRAGTAPAAAALLAQGAKQDRALQVIAAMPCLTELLGEDNPEPCGCARCVARAALAPGETDVRD